MTSFVVNSAGGVPEGFEIVGASPTTAETSGSAVAVSSLPDILIPPRTVSATRIIAKKPARTLRTVLLIFELLN
jgi:hypothetical protein